MRPGDAVRETFEARTGGELPSATPVADLVRTMGGSTAKAAAALGVSQRSVQRYMVAEGKGAKGGKQARGTRAAAAAKAARLDALDRAGPIKRIQFRAYFRISDNEVYRASSVDLDPQEAAALRDEIERGDWDAAADLVFDIYDAGNGLEVNDVEEFAF